MGKKRDRDTGAEENETQPSKKIKVEENTSASEGAFMSHGYYSSERYIG